MPGRARIEGASNGVKSLSRKRCLGVVRIEGASNGVPRNVLIEGVIVNLP